MNQHSLSARLERVAAQVPAGARLADIGSDHAYLPVALLRRGIIDVAVAGEVAATPLRAAQRTVRDNDLDEQVSVRLADGLTALQPADRISAITLCGMGGETIRDILESGQAHLNGEERLILQPNGGEQPLRHWLMTHGYRILHEEVLRENRFDYEVIVADRTGPVAYSDEELYFGPLLMPARSPAFVLKWQRLLKQKNKVLGQLTQARQGVPAQVLQDLTRQLEWIKALLA